MRQIVKCFSRKFAMLAAAVMLVLGATTIGASAATLEGAVLWTNDAGLTSVNQWDNSYLQIASKPEFYEAGTEIGVVYSGDGEPRVILDSETKQVWWIQIDPDRIEKKGDKSVAYFSAATLTNSMTLNAVAPADLRNFCIVAANNNITTYEITNVKASAGNAAEAETVAQPSELPALKDIPVAENSGELTGKTAIEVVDMMGIGWNLGNSFDATGRSAGNVYSHETSWGNPVITKELIQGVKDAGFSTIRIPVTWEKELSQDGKFTINEEFMARVKQVVNWAYELDMFIILNIHHEEWVNDPMLVENQEKIGKQLQAVWTQIADAFAEYDQHLIFEGMNEPRKKGAGDEWNGNWNAHQAVNALSQIFVETVRSSEKGYNQERCLMFPGYAASSSDNVLRATKVPQINGENAKNVILSVHCYAPYDFCLSDRLDTFDINDNKYTSEVRTLMGVLNINFLLQGIPVVIGETGATNSGGNTEAREAWAYYMGQMSEKYGVPIVLWDNGSSGSSGGECHGYFRRKTGELVYPTIVQALFDGADSMKKTAEEEPAQTEEQEAAQSTQVQEEAQNSEAEDTAASQEKEETAVNQSNDNQAGNTFVIVGICVAAVAVIAVVALVAMKKKKGKK